MTSKLRSSRTGSKCDLHHVFAKVDFYLEKIEIAFLLVSGTAVFLMTGAILFDVASRLIVGQSHGWGIDLTEMFMFPLAFAAAAYIARIKGHVYVDVLTQRLSDRHNKRLNIAKSFLSLLFTVSILFSGWDSWIAQISSGVSTNSVFVPVFYFSVFVPIGAMILTLEFIVQIISNIFLVTTVQLEE